MRIRRSWVPVLAAGAVGITFAAMIPFLGGSAGAGGLALAASTPRATGSTAQYVPMTPDRILDTRQANQPISGGGYAGPGPISAGVLYTVDLTKTDLPTDAGALALNVTAVGPAGLGNLRIAPSCGTNPPTTSLVNYEPGKDVANYVVVPLQCSSTTAPVQALTLYSAGSATNVTLDVTGTYPAVSGPTSSPTCVPGTSLCVPSSSTSSSASSSTSSNSSATSSSSGIPTCLPSSLLGSTPVCLPGGSSTTSGSATTTSSSSTSASATTTPTSASPTSTTSSSAPGGATTPGFTAVTPYRAVDTRDGTGAPQAPIAANTSEAFQISGTNVPVGASAVAINVTSIAQPGQGNLRVYPDGASLPNTSNVNFIPGVDKAGFVIVQLPADGKIDVYSAGSPDDVVIDVFGYYPATSTLVTQTPVRILDTRGLAGAPTQGLPSPLQPNTAYTVQVTGNGGVPSGASAALLSVTSISPATGVGNLRVFPGGTSAPNASNVNYIGSSFAVANFVIAPLSSDGKIMLETFGSSVDVAVDVLGYVPGSGGTSSSSSTATSTATATGTCTPGPAPLCL